MCKIHYCSILTNSLWLLSIWMSDLIDMKTLLVYKHFLQSQMKTMLRWKHIVSGKQDKINHNLNRCLNNKGNLQFTHQLDILVIISGLTLTLGDKMLHLYKEMET